ncbi:MAG: pilus assembly protein PilM, partial [Elusimicrobiota bacterium]
MTTPRLRAKIKYFSDKVLSKLSPQLPLVAIDIGMSSFKFVRLKKNKNKTEKPELETVHLQAHPTGLAEEEPERSSQLTATCKQALTALKIKNSPIVVSVSGSSVIVREAKLPALAAEELAKSLAFEAEPFIPYDIKEVNLDYSITGKTQEDNQNKYEVILIAAKKDLIENRLSLVAASGRPIIVDVDAFALANFATLLPDIDKETILIVNIGASISNLIVIERGTP